MCERASDLWQQLALASELESHLQVTGLGKTWPVNLNAGTSQMVSFDLSI